MAGTGRKSAGRDRGRDLVDGMTTGWRREMPEVDLAVVELTRRAARLGVILQDRLAGCLEPWNLTQADFNVLNVLRGSGSPYELRPSDMHARLMLTAGGVSNVLGRLLRAGLVERRRDESDGRGLWVRLTASGIETAEATMRAWVAEQELLYRDVTEAQARSASSALREVLLALGDYEPPPPRPRCPLADTPVDGADSA
ncbi:MarR family transcriptional regulator [Saccharopolyspora sp. K220]|uniref:MarR family winged helix-turn-helix transcriptional regulator n=1 Tax=Saccharopolyspora soli TaxID=2926618 RepID=UPI001F5632CD|nr:MarR family transcriptional regulator [Saccharopolyspora soli]MCI2422128.1 MarR family transcriptional regulator [Saccharopolyspora soli]